MYVLPLHVLNKSKNIVNDLSETFWKSQKIIPSKKKQSVLYISFPLISCPDLLLTKPKVRSGQLKKINFFDCLDCERMTRVLYPARSMACAPKVHSLQSLQFCSNVFWRVKQQIWYSREVFSKPRLYSHLNTSKKGRDFEDLFRAWAVSSPVTFLTGDHVCK